MKPGVTVAPPASIDARARGREVADVGGRSDGDEAAVLDRKRLGPRLRRIDRDTRER